jgi:hypothetical protein
MPTTFQQITGAAKVISSELNFGLYALTVSSLPGEATPKRTWNRIKSESAKVLARCGAMTMTFAGSGTGPVLTVQLTIQQVPVKTTADRALAFYETATSSVAAANFGLLTIEGLKGNLFIGAVGSTSDPIALVEYVNAAVTAAGKLHD